MNPLWTTHEPFMINLWTMYEPDMNHLWCKSEPFMDHLWTTGAPLMNQIRTLYEPIMYKLWTMYKPCMHRVWAIYGPCMDNVWTMHGPSVNHWRTQDAHFRSHACTIYEPFMGAGGVPVAHLIKLTETPCNQITPRNTRSSPRATHVQPTRNPCLALNHVTCP